MGLARLELATSPLSGVRSNRLSYRPVIAPVERCLTHRATRRCLTDTLRALSVQGRPLKTEPEFLCHTNKRLTELEVTSTSLLLRKEVIQPQGPLRLPCYDFTPVIDHTIGGFLPCGLEHRLPVQ